MSRVRASYGVMPSRRADSMEGSMPSPMTMERIPKKEFMVPEPMIMAMGAAPEPPETQSPEVQAAPPTPEETPNPYTTDPYITSEAAIKAVKNRQKQIDKALEYAP